MAMAPSIPLTSRSPNLSPTSSSCSLHAGHLTARLNRLTVRCSKAEGPLRRPSSPVKEASPPLTRPAAPLSPSSPPPPSPGSSSATVPSPSAPSALPVPSKSTIVTIEYQRQRAKELQDYFLDKKYEEQSSQGRIFGFFRKNEISNGRWAMFGIAVGLLTEYATGSNFVDQMKIIISNLGIADLD